MAERLGLAAHLLLLGVRADMPEVCRQLDLLVCTSHSETMPLAVIEAMASGLPVVAPVSVACQNCSCGTSPAGWSRRTGFRTSRSESPG